MCVCVCVCVCIQTGEREGKEELRGESFMADDMFDAIVRVDERIREDAMRQGMEDGRKRAQYEARTAAREIGATAGALQKREESEKSGMCVCVVFWCEVRTYEEGKRADVGDGTSLSVRR